jgi:Ca-activated chloride channel family protein
MNSLKLTATLNQKYIRPGRKATLYLLLDLEAVETKQKEGRLPLNLGFVIDRSGSMSGEKFHYTKQAVQYAAGHLASSDIA